MPLYGRRPSYKMSETEIADDVTVVDVYDIASDIGKECEVMIDKYGTEAISSLLPKVINALELLENLAIRNERENTTLQDLYDKIAQLENDKMEKAEYRQRFEKELEIIEEQWRAESAELVSAVSRLQEENRRLVRSRDSNAGGVGGSCSSSVEGGGEGGEVWRRMGELQEQQRSIIREREGQLHEKQKVIEGLTSQVKRLAATSREVRRKQKFLLQQMRIVCNQRAELEATAQARQRELISLRQAITGDKNATSSSLQLAEILKERDQLREQVEALKKNIQPPIVQPVEVDPEQASCCSEEEGLPEAAPPSTSVGGLGDEAPVQGPLPYEPDDPLEEETTLASGSFFGSYSPSMTSLLEHFLDDHNYPHSQREWRTSRHPATSEFFDKSANNNKSSVSSPRKEQSEGSIAVSEMECTCDERMMNNNCDIVRYSNRHFDSLDEFFYIVDDPRLECDVMRCDDDASDSILLIDCDNGDSVVVDDSCRKTRKFCYYERSDSDSSLISDNVNCINSYDNSFSVSQSNNVEVNDIDLQFFDSFTNENAFCKNISSKCYHIFKHKLESSDLSRNNDSLLTNRNSNINQDGLLTNYDSLLTNHDSLLTNHDSLMANHDSLLTNCDTPSSNSYSLLRNNDSLLTNQISFKNDDSLLTNIDSLLTSISSNRNSLSLRRRSHIRSMFTNNLNLPQSDEKHSTNDDIPIIPIVKRKQFLFNYDSHSTVGSVLPDYGNVCRFCLKIKKCDIRKDDAFDLATELRQVSLNASRSGIFVDGIKCDVGSSFEIDGNVIYDVADKRQNHELLVCVAAALKCLLALILRHCDHYKV